MAGTFDRWGLLLSASAIIATASSGAAAQNVAAPAAPAPQQEQTAEPAPAAEAPAAEEEEYGDDVIVVVAEQADQSRIDRRVYSLGDDPVSQTSTMLDVLGRVPSVTVAPSGAVRLLGGDATIQVDGQPVPGASLDAVLRSLSGSDIERIEVITNPSAQFAAQTEGGIINIITRQRFRLGLTGSVVGSVDNDGGYQFNVSPTWTRGDWSYGVRFGVNRFTWEGDSIRTREDLATGDITRDDGFWEGAGTGMNGGGMLNYRPSDRTRASFHLNGFDWSNDGDSGHTRVIDTGPLYSQTLQNSSSMSNVRLGFNGQQSGAAEGELYKLNAWLVTFENEQDTLFTLTPADGSPLSSSRSPTSSESVSGNAKFDYERPFGENNLLSLGAAIDHTDQQIDTAFETLAGTSTAPDYQNTLTGVQTTAAVYGTYQFAAGPWTFLPGVRVEQYRREIASSGGEDDEDAIDAFPSVHMRRNLRENLDLDLSYSSRISRPQINQLDPALRYLEATRATGGNPDLQPTTTDAFEANLVYQDRDRTFNVTFYDRISHDIVTQFTEVTTDGVFITRPVNAGESEQRGAQVIMRAPIRGGWRYALSANVLQREFDVLQQGQLARRSELEYSGNGQIEYRDRNQSEIGADHLQFEVQFQGPQFFLQGERDEFIVANFTWRRRLTDKVFGVFTVQDVFDSQPNISELRTDSFFERSESRGNGTRFRFALTYQFGSLQQQNQGPPPDADGNGNGMGPPMPQGPQ